MRSTSVMVLCCLVCCISCLILSGLAWSYDDYLVPQSDVYTQWSPGVGDNYARVDDHDADVDTATVFTSSTTWVMDIYEAGVDDGEWSGPHDTQHYSVRAKRVGGTANGYLKGWYCTWWSPAPGGPPFVLAVDTTVPVGNYESYTCDDDASEWDDWDEAGPNPPLLKISGYRSGSVGNLWVDEVWIAFD